MGGGLVRGGGGGGVRRGGRPPRQQRRAQCKKKKKRKKLHTHNTLQHTLTHTTAMQPTLLAEKQPCCWGEEGSAFEQDKCEDDGDDGDSDGDNDGDGDGDGDGVGYKRALVRKKKGEFSRYGEVNPT